MTTSEDTRSGLCSWCGLKLSAIRTLSEPDKWAQQNPEAWEGLRREKAVVVPLFVNSIFSGNIGWSIAREYIQRTRLDKPFKRDEESGE